MKTVSLGEIAKIFNGNSISVAEKNRQYRGVAGIPYIGTAEVGFDSVIDYHSGVAIPESKVGSFRIAQSGTPLVCAEGGSAGRKIGITDRPVCFGNKLFAIEANADWDGKFLFYFCQSEMFQNQFKEMTTGLIGGVSIKKFKQIEVPHFSLPQQKIISSKLDDILSEIYQVQCRTERACSDAKALFDKILDLAVLGRMLELPDTDETAESVLAEIRAKRDSAPKRRQGKRSSGASTSEDTDSPAEILPASWQWVRLDSLCVGISDGVHQTPKYVDDGIPFVTVRNLTAGRGIDFNNLKYVTESDHQEYIKRTNPEKGDILISKDGTIGVVRLVEDDIDFSIFVSVALVKPALSAMSKYIYYALSAICVQCQIVPQGTALKHLYLNDLRRLWIPLPPLDHQTAICDFLDGIADRTNRLSDIYDQKMAEVSSLRSCVLSSAIDGSLLHCEQMVAA